MLNFDEQTGIGVLMIVWSFLLQTNSLQYIKTHCNNYHTTNHPTYSFHKQWHPIAPTILTLHSENTINTYTSDSEHTLSIFTIIFTLEFMLIIHYQWARSRYWHWIYPHLPEERACIHATYCMTSVWVCIPFLFWQIRPSFVHIVHTSLNSFPTAKTMNETHCTWAYMHYVLQGMTNKKSSKDSATCTW